MYKRQTVSGATDIIINFSGDIGIQEVYEAVSYLTEVAGDEANIIFGNVESEDVPDDEVSITIIATGLHDVSGKGASAVKVRKPAADKNNAESNGPTYSGQAIKLSLIHISKLPEGKSMTEMVLCWQIIRQFVPFL